MSTHTPGPWTVSLTPWQGIDGPHLMIAAPGGLTSIAAAFGDTASEIAANATLIAAAPDLLAALVALAGNSVADYDDEAHSHARSVDVQAARALLARLAAL